MRLKWSLVRQLKSKNHKILICSTLYWCAENLAHQTPFEAHQSPFETHHQGGLPSLRSAFPKWGEFQRKNKPSCLRQPKQKK